MKKYESVVIVGSSGSGKTTLVNGLRVPHYADKLAIPARYITRPARQGDDMVENRHVSHEVFQTGVDDGTILPHWSRTLDGGRVERYGFDKVNDDRLRVYSANNAFLRDPNPSIETVLRSGLVVHVMASEIERSNRLDERSPDMASAERQVRLADGGQDMAHTNLEIIDTSQLTDVEGQLALQSIVEQVIRRAQ
jgi:ribose 1,5-bisphosphokinase PhnN